MKSVSLNYLETITKPYARKKQVVFVLNYPETITKPRAQKKKVVFVCLRYNRI